MTKLKKKFFSRTTGPISTELGTMHPLVKGTQVCSTKLGTKHPWVKGTQGCSNEGPCPFLTGDNYEIAKLH